jgi:hypothetical protein
MRNAGGVINGAEEKAVLWLLWVIKPNSDVRDADSRKLSLSQKTAACSSMNAKSAGK